MDEQKEKKPWGEPQRLFCIIMAFFAMVTVVASITVICYFCAPTQYATVAYTQSGESGTQTTANVGK